MTYDAWMELYKRLCVTYGKTASGEQGAAYFEALSPYPDTCVQQAVQRGIRELKQWPTAASLVELAREERMKLTAPASVCPTCHGETWVPGPPRHEFGNVYETVVRCPTCWTFGKKESAA